MNIKDMIIPLILAVATTWGIHYFFFGSKDTAQQYEFSAPQTVVECAPLSKDISFATEKRPKREELVPVETSWGSLEFSTDAASLSRLVFKRSVNGARTLGTIFPTEA